MNKYSVLLVPILLFAGGRVLAQTAHGKEETEKAKKETSKETAEAAAKPATVIKVVPPARDRKAKPAKVSPAKARAARPEGAKPARNPRPSARPPRPGNGRH